MKQKSFFRVVKKVFSFFTLGDLILTVIIFIIAVLLIFNNLHSDSKIVRINYQNKLFGEYKLDKPQIIVISENIQVEISNNKVRMLKNNCSNQLCVKQGWSSNFPIICVPNKVDINIIDSHKKDEIRHILK